MTELQSTQRRSSTARAIFGLLLAVVMVGAFATAGSAENTGTPRSGHLLVTKECPHIDQGYCTITGSNLNAIKPGMNVVYTDLTVGVDNVLRSHLFIDGPGNNDAHGYVELDVAPGPTSSAARSISRAGPDGSAGSTRTSTSPATSPTAPRVCGTERITSPHPATTNKPKRNP